MWTYGYGLFESKVYMDQFAKFVESHSKEIGPWVLQCELEFTLSEGNH